MTTVLLPMTVLQARALTGGGLSVPSKMPCKSYGLPAGECITGSKLRVLPNTPCSGCYAFKGNYLFRGVTAAHYRRLGSLSDPRWVAAMVLLIEKQSPLYFRWHHSGDLQSVDHLNKIVDVCRATPGTRHWLPTQERRIVKDWRARYGALPENLTVRISAPILGGVAPMYAGDPELCSSIVVTEARADVHNCPARHQDNHCGDCRACWDRTTKCVAYPLH